MLEKHPSITSHLKPNLLHGNCLDFGDSAIGTNVDMSALKESISKESRAAGNNEWANPQRAGSPSPLAMTM